MLTASALIAVLGAVAFVAVAVAGVATIQARAARAALLAADCASRERGELAGTLAADSRLAGDVAHDLDDLLTGIAGRAELLIASLDPAGSGVQDAHEIRRAALSAARLTRPLRTLSGGSRAPVDAIDVNAVTARAVRALQQMLDPRIEVALALDHDVKRARIAASQLEEIVLKLGIRARDAMPSGGRVTVSTSGHTPAAPSAAGAPSEYVRLVVADTAEALPAEARARLFEPLFTAEAQVHAVDLASVASIVKLAGGRIEVDSAVGAGSTFIIDLPATTEPETGRGRIRPAAQLAEPVLVVEDEPGMRELMRLVLVRAGHGVVTAAGPHAALDALKAQPGIALMLVDIVMPEMDGYDLVAQARTISPGIRAVFISAFAPDPARHSRSDGFLAKPFASESLIEIVDRALQ